MHFRPRDDLVLVRPLKAEELGPADRGADDDGYSQGIVEAVGPGRLIQDGSGRRVARDIQRKTHVWFRNHRAEQLTLGKTAYVLVYAEDIVGDRV